MGGLRIYSPGELAETRPDVTAGEGEYVEPDDLNRAVIEWGLPTPMTADVVATILKAREIGHAGFADYGTVELALRGAHKDVINEWLARAKGSLEALEVKQEEDRVEDAVIVPEPTALELEEKARQLADDADSAEADDDNEKAERLRAEAQDLHDRAKAMAGPEQLEID